MKNDPAFPQPGAGFAGLGWPASEHPHERALAFFRSNAPDPIEAACRLGRFFGCSPTEFLKTEPAIVAAIIEHVIALMEEELDDHA